MDPQENEDLVEQLRRAYKVKKPFYFWFCPKGKDDDLPIMFVEKKHALAKQKGRKAKSRAKVKLFAHGTVERGADGLVFCNEVDIDGKKIERVFKTKMATQAPLKKIAMHLRSATVVTQKQYEELKREGGLDAPEDIPTSMKGTGLEAEFRRKYEIARELVQTARDTLGTNNPGYQVLKAARIPILAARDGGDWEEAIRLLDDLIEKGKETLDASLQQEWDELLPVAKQAFTGAIDELGEGPALEKLRKIRVQAVGKKNAGKWEEAVDLLEEFIEACNEAVGGPETIDADELEKLDEELEADGAALVKTWAGGVADAKLELEKFKAAVLKLPGVVVDPRYTEIQGALKTYDPIPTFDTSLKGALEALSSKSKPRTERVKAVQDAVDKYRKQIDAVPVLKQIDKSDYARAAVRGSLIDALDTVASAVV